jgi:PAS domain S-box-containing protein
MHCSLASSSLRHAVSARLDPFSLLEQAIELSPVSTLLIDAQCEDLPIIYVNPAFERLTGYGIAEVVGQALAGWMQRPQGSDPAPCDQSEGEQEADAFARMAGAIAAGEPWQRIGRNYCKDGNSVWTELQLFPLLDSGGQVSHYIGYQRDLSSERRAQSQTAQHQLILDMVPQAIFWKDRRSVYLGCNRQFAWIAGLSDPEAVVGKTDADLPWSAAETSRFCLDDQQVISTNQPLLHVIAPQRQAQGRQAWVDICKVPLHDAAGQVIGVLGTHQDITDRKLMEGELQASEEKFRNLYEANSDAVILLDKMGCFDCNPATLKLFGYALKTEFCAQELQHFSPTYQPSGEHSDELIKQKILQVMRRDVPPFEWLYCRPDGSEFYAEVVLTRICLEGRRLIQVIIRDISSRKQAEQTLLRQTTELQAAMHELQSTQAQMVQSEKMSALGGLVAGVAHEINNPVGFLAGNIPHALDYIQQLFGLLDLYEVTYPSQTPAIHEYVKQIDLPYLRDDLPKLLHSMDEGVTRIQDISTSLRTFSRSDTQRPVSFDIHHGLNSTLMILKHRLKADQYRPAIQVVTHYGQLPAVECYAGQLNQVFMNLLANAIEALEEGNGGRSFAEIQAKPNQITLITERVPGGVLIRIRDNGVGMSESVQQKIFDDLFTTKPVGKGTGLGLGIAQKIVQNIHHGKLTFRSELGEGTEFTIELPVKVQLTQVT